MDDIIEAVIKLQRAFQNQGLSGDYTLKMPWKDVRSLEYIFSAADAFDRPDFDLKNGRMNTLYGHRIEKDDQ